MAALAKFDVKILITS